MKTFLLNLARRPDRLRHMRAILPPELDVECTTDWAAPIDGQRIDAAALAGFGLFPWRIESPNSWWSRPLKKGEIGCAIGHWLCWRRARESAGETFLFLEDDVVLADSFVARLGDALARLAAFDPRWDFLYLGREPIGRDEPVVPGIVRPGYSYCSYAYALRRSGVEALLATGYERALIPVDELLPALYLDHPRPDVRARYPKRLRAYALEPPLVRQLPKDVAGSDTEASGFFEDAP